jgi:hypothetical protein
MGLAAAGAFALPAGADVSVMSPPVAAIQIGSPAVLGVRGAIVTVPVTVVCVRGSTFNFISVEVVQTVGGGNIARGGGSAAVSTCTGGFQNVDVVVTASTMAFRARVAFASATFNSCDAVSCRSASDQREIRVVR